MICENCKQRPAKVTVTQVQNGQQVQHHYCEICAQHLHPFAMDGQQDPFALHQLLSNWFGIAEQAVQPTQEKQQLACDTCGWTFQQFINKGKFGCADCYDSFRAQLPEVFKRLHNGNAKHVGKIPGAQGHTIQLKKQIETIRLQMKDAIEEENFEQAAKLRDEARALEEQLAGGGDSGHVH